MGKNKKRKNKNKKKKEAPAPRAIVPVEEPPVLPVEKEVPEAARLPAVATDSYSHAAKKCSMFFMDHAFLFYERFMPFFREFILDSEDSCVTVRFRCYCTCLTCSWAK